MEGTPRPAQTATESQALDAMEKGAEEVEEDRRSEDVTDRGADPRPDLVSHGDRFKKRSVLPMLADLCYQSKTCLVWFVFAWIVAMAVINGIGLDRVLDDFDRMLELPVFQRFSANESAPVLS